jgi:hypothetical protein
MCSLEEEECDFWGQNFANSLLFSLAGNLAGEELAPDCALRHAVYTAEKSIRIAFKIAAIPQFLPSNGARENVVPNLTGRLPRVFLWRADREARFH